MAFISDHCTFFGKCVKRVTWDEKRRLDVVLGEELEKTSDTYGPCEIAYSRLLRGTQADHKDNAHLSRYHWKNLPRHTSQSIPPPHRYQRRYSKAPLKAVTRE